jgi:hypothetical protein
MATTISSVFMSLAGIMAGFFRPAGDLIWPLRILNFALPTKYAAEVLAINEFEKRNFTCPGTQALPDGQCPLPTGLDVLEEYTFQPDNYWPYFGILLALTAGLRFFAFMVLKYRKNVLLT